MFNLDPPPDFKPFDPRGELTIYHRNLPHWRQKGSTYFVTFRQADSLPKSKLQELASLKQEWLEKYFSGKPAPTDTDSVKARKKEWEELTQMTMEKAESWLDQGKGSCALKKRKVRKIIENALFTFDGKRYQLGAFVLMPNHVHAIIRPFDESDSLEEILHSRKLWTSRKINEAINSKGEFWQRESFDRIIRDSEHLWKALQYIGQNPSKAKLSERESTLWVRPEWKKLGWDFVNEENY